MFLKDVDGIINSKSRLIWVYTVWAYTVSSPELAQGELLGYGNVRPTCGCPRRRRCPSVNFLACVHARGNSFDPNFMKLCQNVNHHNI